MSTEIVVYPPTTAIIIIRITRGNNCNIRNLQTYYFFFFQRYSASRDRFVVRGYLRTPGDVRDQYPESDYI